MGQVKQLVAAFKKELFWYWPAEQFWHRKDELFRN